MIKSKRLKNYRFPYAILVSKFLEYFEVDLKDKLTETIKSGSEIDCITLMKMVFKKLTIYGLVKVNKIWISKNGDATDFPESSNVGEDAQGIYMNVLVAYVLPVDRGKPLSKFERFMVNRLDSVFATQIQHFEMIEARFEHLDQHIEAVPEQLAVLYHHDN